MPLGARYGSQDSTEETEEWARSKEHGAALTRGVKEGKVYLVLCEPLQLRWGQLSIAGGMCWSQGPREDWQEGY